MDSERRRWFTYRFSGNVIEGAEDGAAGTNGCDGVGIELVLTLLVVASVDDAGGLSLLLFLDNLSEGNIMVNLRGSVNKVKVGSWRRSARWFGYSLIALYPRLDKVASSTLKLKRFANLRPQGTLRSR